MKVSILLSSFNRPHLLRLGLASIKKFKPKFDYEILVLNDYLEDETRAVCDVFGDSLNIRYIFTGQRNSSGNIKKRVSGLTLNVGIKQSAGDIIVLSCPEIFHLNSGLDMIVEKLVQNPMGMVIPGLMYFDQKGLLTKKLCELVSVEGICGCSIDYSLLSQNEEYNKAHVQMPYLMALYKHHLMEIGGYDEDLTGYAGEDNDLVDRLILKGLNHVRTDARIIHLWHEGTGDGYAHWENPAWVHNWNILQARKGILVRNIGKKWGTIDG